MPSSKPLPEQTLIKLYRANNQIYKYLPKQGPSIQKQWLSRTINDAYILCTLVSPITTDADRKILSAANTRI